MEQSGGSLLHSMKLEGTFNIGSILAAIHSIFHRLFQPNILNKMQIKSDRQKRTGGQNLISGHKGTIVKHRKASYNKGRWNV